MTNADGILLNFAVLSIALIATTGRNAKSIESIADSAFGNFSDFKCLFRPDKELK